MLIQLPQGQVSVFQVVITGTVATVHLGRLELFLNSGALLMQGLTNLSAGNIKSGVTIAGTAGEYPSSTYPLNSASATPDLDTATFNARQ